MKNKIFINWYLHTAEAKPEWNQFSDHIPISSSILMSSVQTECRRSRAWKQIDVKKLYKLCDDMSQLIGLQDTAEIDALVLSLEKWLQWMVKKMMLWKRTHDQFNFYWNDECSEAVKKTKKLRQIFINSQNEKNWKIYFHMNDHKQKIIRKTKILKFWKTIDTNVANKKKLWRLIK